MKQKFDKMGKPIFILILTILLINSCELFKQEPARLQIVNESDEIVIELHMRLSGTESWGDDLLGSNRFLYPGDDILIEELSADYYDLKADSLLFFWQETDQYLTEGEKTTWHLTADQARIRNYSAE